MAAVLDALAPYVKRLIADMAEEEVSMLLGVSGEITKLEDNMESIKAFLADAERRRITEQSVRRWVRKLKDAMYDATDIIDLCQLEADKRRESKGASSKEKLAGCFQPLLFCLRNPKFAHEIGRRIKDLNRRLEEIYKGAAKFNFITNVSYYQDRRMITDAERSSLNTMSEFDETAIVGENIEKDTKELAQVLITDDNHDLKVVSIVGMGGMGKTTLAQKIFNETTIQEHFKVKVWLSITQHFDEAELLRAAISHAGGHHGGEQDKSKLVQTLTNTLSASKFLLVMDDVWGDSAWNNVLTVPIKNACRKQPGSRVLVTTRFDDLAWKMRASLHQHRVSPLDEEDAWSLLKKQLPHDQVVGTDHLKDIGMKIIRKCGGLPLAVKVMGGLLSTRSQSEREWEAVLNHRAWSVDGLPMELDNRIYLSYEDLSPPLKQCFLYCSLFPKGTSIWQIKVVPMWISEGFIQPQGGSFSHDDRLEETATEYYKELITRNLIEPIEGSTVHCTMHDVVRSFAEYMAGEESLVVQDGQLAAGGSKGSLVHHMSLGPTKLVPEWADLQKQESLRTLIINCKINIKPGDSLTSFSRLRVLSIKVADCDRLIDSLCQLRHLRYIQLEKTNISSLPHNINTMKFLQHIVLRDCRNLENLPTTIIKLVHLRTIDLYGSNLSVVVPKGFGRLTNLRTLFGFSVHMDTDGDGEWCSLEEIGPLSQLRKLTLHGLENVPSNLFAEMAMISSKEHLDYLDLNWSSSGIEGLRDEIEKQQHVVEEVLEKLCPPSCIETLLVKGYFGRELANWMTVRETGAFKSLMNLKLQDLPCCTRLPDGFCRLPSLKALNIVGAPAIKSVGFEFQASSSVAVRGGGSADTSAAFPKLTSIHLEGLREWEEWDWEEQAVDVTGDAMAMPALEELTIKNCKLSCLPRGLATSRRHALRGLYLYKLTNLISVENFPSVVQLDVFVCPALKRISGLSRLHKIRIVRCANVEALEGVPSLDSLVLWDATMEALPGYLQAVSPRYIDLKCSKNLYESINSGSSSECNKISHMAKHDIDYIEDSEDSDAESQECSDDSDAELQECSDED
ncbi:putative disease resistance protein RGA3 [Panicum miliaceum]|uniref:Disease resistance protein RGA3 n=1 Tax=Panicum miliaceum TaxID=4540 RepID=A0A3L6TBX8_PANMI|nr:putative disease resistance protein RGA3 [Panicum miliaceum]